MIGFFQFDNLVKSGVPFMIVAVEVDPYSFYKEQHRHIQSYTQNFSKNGSVQELDQKIKELKVSKEFPIVILCQDGKKSFELSQGLESLGYMNAYHVLDGFQSFGQH